MAGQARDLQMTAGCETSAIITARACPAPPRLLAQALSDGDERVLRALGDHLGHLASRDLAARCRLGTRHRRQDWAIRKRALTCECSSRWAGSITSWNN